MGTNGPGYSIVVPTLQLSPILGDLLSLLATSPIVREIIVINNSERDLTFDGELIRVLSPGANIFVNPAWNAGRLGAQEEYLAIINDDVLFNPSLLEDGLQFMLHRRVGILGADMSSRNWSSGRKRFSPVQKRREGFGVLMLMPTKNYVLIPEELKIWQGDDFLFYQQKSQNYVFAGYDLWTPHHTTAGRPEFAEQKKADFAAYMGRYHEGNPYWSRPGIEARAIRALMPVWRRLRPLPTDWDYRRQ